MNLTRISIARPVFVLMMMLASILMGYLSYTSMRLELNPDVSFGVVSINTVYPGAGPEEVNEQITRKVEQAVSGINGLRELTGSSQEGLSVVVAQFELEQNIDVALADVRSKVDGIAGELPRDALKPVISKVDTASEPVLTLAFRSDRLASKDLRDLVDEQFRDRFAQIRGVASAFVQGGDEREIQVRLRTESLLAHGIGITEIQRQIASATLSGPAGRLVEGDREFSIRVPAEFRTVDEIRDMILTISDPENPMAKGKTIRLGEVADVVDSVRERTQYSRLNGSDTIILSIAKTREGNAIEITAQAEELIETLRAEFAEDQIEIVKTFEQAEEISNSLRDLNFDLFFAIVLVSLIVYVFLHDIRGTIIVAIAIPTCLFFTFIALKLLGMTINNLTMLALTLAVGVLVDDAIVVLENIYRHLKMGEDPRDAALNGRGEIGLAAIAITLADVVVFLPIAFLPGVTGQFFRPLAVGFVTAVLFSLFVSFTITPMLASRWYKAGEDIENPKGRFAQWFERGFHRLENSYRRTLEWSLAHRWFVFISGNLALVSVIFFIAGSNAASVAGAAQGSAPLVGIAVVVGALVFIGNLFRRIVKPQFILYGLLFGLIFPGAAIAGHVYGQWKGEAVFKFAFLPETDQGRVLVNIQLPPGSSLEATQRVVDYAEEKMRAFPDDVEYIVSSVGSQGFTEFEVGSTGSNFAQVAATLYPKQSLKDVWTGANRREKLRARSDQTVAAEMLAAIGRFPGAQITVTTGDGFGFGSAIQMSFTSNDREKLLDTVVKVRDGLDAGAVNGVISPEISTKPGKPELQVVPDRALLADHGLTAFDLAGAVRTLYQGDDTTKFRVLGKEYDIRVMMDRRDRDDPSTLAGVPIAFDQGIPIYVDNVATVQARPAVDKIDRRNRQEEIRVTADLLPGFAAGSVQAEIDSWIARENLVAEGVKFRPLGQADAQAREGIYLFGAIGIGVLLVYMLLASLYDNLLYPFIIQIAQPQAMVGALLALIITDKSLNIVGMIGIIALTGLVGKNAILLVDYTNTLRARGRSRYDALVEAGPIRLRPILMTTLALIMGTMPIALAIGRGSEFRETIGIAIIGGISLSTILTLVVIPCSYTIMDDISNAIGRLRGGRSGGDSGQGQDPASQDVPATVQA